MTAPLHDLRIVDLTTGISGAVATLFFADFGGSVVKVEPPGGDPARSEPGFAMWARGKRSLVLDLTGPEGAAALAGLLGEADVCVCNDDGSDASSPIAAAIAAAANPRLVVLEMPAYIGPAPWAGNGESNELLSAAMGASLRQSSFEDAPVDPVADQLLYEQGIWAGACALAALVEREDSGLGQRVLVSGAHGAAIAGAGLLLVDPASTAVAPPAGPGGPNQSTRATGAATGCGCSSAHSPRSSSTGPWPGSASPRCWRTRGWPAGWSRRCPTTRRPGCARR